MNALFFFSTGTAANALALSCLTPPWGAVFAHRDAHIIDSECGAPEFFTLGAKIVGVDGENGKISPQVLARVLSAYIPGSSKQVWPAALSISQVTEAGTVYSLPELSELTSVARKAGLALHMDGARFANAIASLKASPAEVTWKRGIDVLSLGATKNGAMACEAVVFFDTRLAGDFLARRKRGGHTLSKNRYAAAQMLAYLQDDTWLSLASHANTMAHKLGAGLRELDAVSLAWPVDANEVFAVIPSAMDVELREAGANYYNWPVQKLGASKALKDDQTFIRLVTSFATDEETVARFLKTAQRVAR